LTDLDSCWFEVESHRPKLAVSRKKHVTKVVGVTSSAGFLVKFYLFTIIIIILIIPENVYRAVIMVKAIMRVHPVYLLSVDSAPGCRQPKPNV